MSEEENESGDLTTDAAVAAYHAVAPIFHGLLEEVRVLSKKKPDGTMSEGKVRIINRALEDLLGLLKAEPMGKYLELLDDKALPQMSDAVLTMVQFATALKAFENRYCESDFGESHWRTAEGIAESDESDDESEKDEDDDQEDNDNDE